MLQFLCKQLEHEAERNLVTVRKTWFGSMMLKDVIYMCIINTVNKQ